MNKLFLLLFLLLGSVSVKAQGEVETWNLKTQIGGTYGTGCDKSLSFDINASYNATEFIAVGFATGVWTPRFNTYSAFFPILGTITFMIPPKNEKAKTTPLCDLRLGTAIPIKSNTCTMGVLEVAPGLSIRMNDKMDFIANFVYQGVLALGEAEGFNNNNIGARVGLSFHLYK